ncbi:MAG: PGF-pre-PGF domain-containing protein, partial [Hadesarchaea archaeon]|nr:PGF-pre-PGF domain-containing protein [Hadesarchaea archaeon]
VIIRFKVEKSWIILNEINIATITLNRYDSLTGEWTSLPTTYLSEDDTYVYFSAISPGLSVFGVSGSKIIPANFELSNLVITPSEVSAGETVTISVVVNNVGGRTGSTTVTLEINGVAVDTRSATLDAGESTTVTFTVSEDAAGTYTVNVAGLTGSFVVTALPAPPIVPLAVSIIIIALAIGIVMWLWRIR